MNRLTFLLLIFSIGVKAQIPLSYYLPQNIKYNPKIPTPKSVIGHDIGERHISHDKLLAYMQSVSIASERISLENRGETYQGRPLLLLIVTSAENHTKLNDIQKKHIALTNDEHLDVSGQPIVVYQGFSIHGNEASGSNAALALIYYLAAAQSAELENLLQNTVILFDPSFNPDGLQRFANWVNNHRSKNINSDSNDREFHEGWPRGRTNHYWFDMNRDWLPVQLPESSARIKTYHDWLPNILTDHHEMGTNTSFFFQPGVPNRTHPLTPQLNQKLTKEIAIYHAKALDKIGSLYYTEEDFDDFYYGKGSTFPDINGSIGILFEQASARGHAQDSDNGLLSFPFAIRNQFTVALSTLKAANKMRVKLLRYQQDFYKQVRSLKQDKILVFGDEKDAAKTHQLAEVLQKHRIVFHHLKDDFETKEKKFKKGYAYAIPLKQKNHRLIKAMFETQKTFNDSLFYDVSAWSFKFAFGLDFVESLPAKLLGEPVKELKKPKGFVSSISNIGYLIPWNEYYAPKALNLIFSKGLRAKVSLKNFKNNQITFDYGTLFVPTQKQDLSTKGLYKFLTRVAKECNLPIFGVATGLNEGIDLGSRNFKALKKPTVALLVGKGISSYDAGEIWHLFDQRFNTKITKLDTDYINTLNLSKYSTIIAPNSYALNQNTIAKLKSWVKNGGALIGYRNSLKWLASQKFINIEFNKAKNDTVKNVSYENKDLKYGAQVIGGAIFEARIDRSHPINFGYKNDKLALFRNTTLFIKPDKKSYNNPVLYTENPLLSGYISKENLKSLKNTSVFKAQKLGLGRVLIFTDNTNFRGFWFGTNKLLFNAVYFAHLM
ncbi:MAG: M14 family metallopeptidase [Tenacibaculum sp.]